MKKFLRYLIILLLTILLFLISSCRSKKEFIQERRDSIRTEVIKDTIKINTRIIIPNDVIFNNSINLNNIDLIKRLYNKNNPMTTVDKETGSIIESYIDSSNNLRQKIKAKNNPINISDTTKTKTKEVNMQVKEDKKEKIIIEEKKLTFWDKIKNILNTIKNVVLIAIILIVFLYLNRIFNIVGFIKSLFNKK